MNEWNKYRALIHSLGKIQRRHVIWCQGSFFLSSYTPDLPWDFGVRRRPYRYLSPQFSLSFSRRWYPEDAQPAPLHKPIHTSQNFCTHRFNVPTLAWRFLQDHGWIWIYNSRFCAVRFTSGTLLALLSLWTKLLNCTAKSLNSKAKYP